MRVLLRADASSAIGTGHVMRCVALADALLDRGHHVAMASAELVDGPRGVLARRGIEVLSLSDIGDAEELTAVAAVHGADWIVLDGYGFDADFVARVRTATIRTLLIDDRAALERYDADLVLNQNAHASPGSYGGRIGGARLLLGPKFALLRREFLGYLGTDHALRPRVTRLLLTFGGTDPARATERVVGSLAPLAKRVPITVVIGGGNRRADSLMFDLAGAEGIDVVRAPDDMPVLMAAADLAVSSASSTIWELAFMGIPSLLVVTADNQVPIADSLQRLGLARSLGPLESLDDVKLRAEVLSLAADTNARGRMAAVGRALVDGHGARRVAQAMESAGIELRAARPADAALLFEWANDAETRAASFSSEPISWEAHVVWLASRLADPESVFFVAIAGGVPVGQVRFDRVSSDETVISVSVAPSARGRGLAPAIIDAGGRAVFARWPIRRILAEIRSQNRASVAAFASAGFGGPRESSKRADAQEMWLDRPDGTAAPVGLAG